MKDRETNIEHDQEEKLPLQVTDSSSFFVLQDENRRPLETTNSEHSFEMSEHDHRSFTLVSPRHAPLTIQPMEETADKKLIQELKKSLETKQHEFTEQLIEKDNQIEELQQKLDELKESTSRLLETSDLNIDVSEGESEEVQHQKFIQALEAMANDKLRTHHNQLELQALKQKELEEKLNQEPGAAPVSEMRDKDQEIESLQRQIAILENRNVPQENLISLEDVNLEFVEGETP